MKRPLLTAILLAFLIITPALVLGQTTEVQSDPVRAMSFNIRLGVAKDGDNHWEKRKETVVQAITEFAPDFVGTQETYEFQENTLAKTFLNTRMLVVVDNAMVKANNVAYFI